MIYMINMIYLFTYTGIYIEYNIRDHAFANDKCNKSDVILNNSTYDIYDNHDISVTYSEILIAFRII